MHKSGTPLVIALLNSQINCAFGIGQLARLFGQSSGMMTAVFDVARHDCLTGAAMKIGGHHVKNCQRYLVRGRYEDLVKVVYVSASD